MEWILLGILVVAFTFYYSYRQGQDARQAEKRKSFEEAMSRQTEETMELKDIVAEEPGAIEHTKNGIAYLTLQLRSSSGGRPRSVVIFGKKAEEIAPQIRRGTRIRATGRPTTKTLANREGKTIKKFELIASKIELVVKPDASGEKEQTPESS